MGEKMDKTSALATELDILGIKALGNLRAEIHSDAALQPLGRALGAAIREFDRPRLLLVLKLGFDSMLPPVVKELPFFGLRDKLPRSRRSLSLDKIDEVLIEENCSA